MVNIARSIAARAAVNRPLRIDLKEVFPAPFIHFFVRDKGAGIFDDTLTLGDRF